MKIELSKPPARKRTPITATTRLRMIHEGVAYYRYDRRSKKSSPDEPDFYWIALDEKNCIAGPCQCKDYLIWRKPVAGEKCTHQQDAEEQMREKKALATAKFHKVLGDVCG